jgi:hypothetical protein
MMELLEPFRGHRFRLSGCCMSRGWRRRADNREFQLFRTARRLPVISFL